MSAGAFNGQLELHDEVLQLFPSLEKEDIIKKAYEIREKALSKDFYRCIDGLHFLKLGLKLNPFYGDTFQEGKLSKLRILEIGCCFGVDFRRLIVDGANIRDVFGVDLSEALINLGFELFEDMEALKGRFIVADATSEDFVQTVSEQIGGTFDVIILQLVLHTVAEREMFLIQNIFQLLNSGGILIGSTVGTEENLDHQLYVGVGPQRRVIHSEHTLHSLLAFCGFSNIAIRLSKFSLHDCPIGWIEENFSFSLETACLGYMAFRCTKP
ncbi:hypothetical protein GpartN1_g185.t1 [Galdieria partita]|uniref:Methyltransferase domain-containing protein n=1 Tax=Galdieria partita TaxID=83374 RepID=A0A9C7UM95_9RHOD|nr:hypothetical protein GpartN1_g185.t1 [Galdieria partita]